MTPVLTTKPTCSAIGDEDQGDARGEPDLLIPEARRRQHRRRIAIAAAGLLALGTAVAVTVGEPASHPLPLVDRPLRLPALGAGGRCPVTRGRSLTTRYFVGPSFGRGPVRLLLADRVNPDRGRLLLGGQANHGWFGLQTLWYAMPTYDGPFIVRAAALGARHPIDVTPGATGQEPGGDVLAVAPGPTLNTFYTNWRPGHLRDSVTGRLVPTLTGYGYRTQPGSSWVRSPGCYAWQIDGVGFTETIVIDIVASKV